MKRIALIFCLTAGALAFTSCQEKSTHQENEHASIGGIEVDDSPRLTTRGNSPSAPSLQEDSLEAYLAKGTAYKTAHELQDALRTYNLVLASYPGHAEALWNKSHILAMLGSHPDHKAHRIDYYNEALSLAKRAYDIDPTNPGTNFAMAMALKQVAALSGIAKELTSGKYIKGYVERALELDPEFDEALAVLAEWHHDVVRFDNNKQAIATSIMGSRYLDKASYEKAEALYTKAMEINPDYIEYHVKLGTLYMEHGDAANARKNLEAAVSLPDFTHDDPELKLYAQRMLTQLM